MFLPLQKGHTYSIFWKLRTDNGSKALVGEPEGSTPLIAKPTIGHDPEPVFSNTSNLYIPFK
jgi:hypothetical protein